MRTKQQLEARLSHYGAAEYIYDPDVGYIAWHYSTGENIEMLFIEAKEPRRGFGTELYRRMIQEIQRTGKGPYHSIFGYHLGRNTEAHKFYDALGWTQVNLGQSIYATDDTVLMWIPWVELVRRLMG